MFQEFLYGPRPRWPKREKDNVYAPRGRVQRQCPCGVPANYGLVPSQLGVGLFCGHMVGGDVVSHFCFQLWVVCDIVIYFESDLNIFFV